MTSGWRRRAACRDMDPELFFPVGSTGPALVQIDDAKRVCRSCPVVEPCLELALALKAVGVWGGLSDDERNSLKRRQQRAALRAAAKTTA